MNTPRLPIVLLDFPNPTRNLQFQLVKRTLEANEDNSEKVETLTLSAKNSFGEDVLHYLTIYS